MKFNRRLVTLLLCSIFFSIVPQNAACAAFNTFVPSAKKRLALTTTFIAVAPGIQALSEAVQTSLQDTRDENLAQKDKKLTKLALIKIFGKKLKQNTFKKELWKKHYKNIAHLKKCFSRRKKDETWKQWRIRTQQECAVFGKENPVFTTAVALWTLNATGSLAVAGYQKLTHKKNTPPPAPAPQPVVPLPQPPLGGAAPVSGANPQPNPAQIPSADDDDDEEVPFVPEAPKKPTPVDTVPVADPAVVAPKKPLTDEEKAEIERRVAAAIPLPQPTPQPAGPADDAHANPDGSDTVATPAPIPPEVLQQQAALRKALTVEFQEGRRYVNMPAIKEFCSQTAAAIAEAAPRFRIQLGEEPAPVDPTLSNVRTKKDHERHAATEAEVTRLMTGVATDDPEREDKERQIRRKLHRKQTAVGPVSRLAIQHEEKLEIAGELLTQATNSGAQGALKAIADNPVLVHGAVTGATALATLALGNGSIIGHAAAQAIAHGGAATMHFVVEPYLREHPEVRETIANVTEVVRNETAKIAVLGTDVALQAGKTGVAALGGAVPTLGHVVAAGAEYALDASPWIKAGVHGTLLVGTHACNYALADDKTKQEMRAASKEAGKAGVTALGGIIPTLGHVVAAGTEYALGTSPCVQAGVHGLLLVGAHIPQVHAAVTTAEKMVGEVAQPVITIAQEKVLPVVAGGAVLGAMTVGGVGPALGQVALGGTELYLGASLPLAAGLHVAATVGAHAYNYLEAHPETKAKVIAVGKSVAQQTATVVAKVAQHTATTAVEVAKDAYHGYEHPCREKLAEVVDFPSAGATIVAGLGDAAYNTAKAALQPDILPHTLLATAQTVLGSGINPLSHAALLACDLGADYVMSHPEIAAHTGEKVKQAANLVTATLPHVTDFVATQAAHRISQVNQIVSLASGLPATPVTAEQVKETAQAVKEGTKRALWRGAFSTAYFGKKVANLWHAPTNFLAHKLTLPTAEPTQLPPGFPEDTTPRIEPKIEEVD